MPFAMILVFRPRPKRPRRPSWSTTSLAASAVRKCQHRSKPLRDRHHLQYETLVSLTWRYVLTTLRELDTESDTMEAQKPMKARRASQTIRGCFGGSARAPERKLYYHRISISWRCPIAIVSVGGHGYSRLQTRDSAQQTWQLP